MSRLFQLPEDALFAGDFRVKTPLRAGGMGALYVVEQISTGKLRALKLMLPEIVARPDLRRRFELEARVGARIKSDHVVEVIASGVDVPSGVPWLAMELLEGEDLAGLIEQKGRLSLAEVREVTGQLCHALGEAHRQSIVHRDLKPENIFLAEPRRRGVPFTVKVLDFGISRVTAEAQATSSATRTALGTPLWMAPEQAEPGEPITPRADVWALGLVVFRMLTGRYFWKSAYAESGSVMMLMREAFGRPIPSASARATEYGCEDLLPEGFDAWFARCVACEPGARYADAAEAHSAFERALGEGEGRAPFLSLPDSAARPSWDVIAQGPMGMTEAMPAPPTAALQKTEAGVVTLSPDAGSGVMSGRSPDSRGVGGAPGGFLLARPSRAALIAAGCALIALAFAISRGRSEARSETARAVIASGLPLSLSELPSPDPEPVASLPSSLPEAPPEAPLKAPLQVPPKALPKASAEAKEPPPAPVTVKSASVSPESPALCRPGGGKRNGAACVRNEECCSDYCSRAACRVRKSPRRVRSWFEWW